MPGRSSVERLVLGGVCGDHVEARVGGELGDQRLVSAGPGPVWIDVLGDVPGVVAGPDEPRFGLVETALAWPALSGVLYADF
ncbi:MAG TPA: hypothetical protein VNB91_07155, partial [Jatrophihabitantaceae bacterium]|nr:hypothetical protein [Jatrophihabitantaceae bacterium]